MRAKGTNLTFICRRDDLSVGEMRSMHVGRLALAVCRREGGFAVLRDICPHQGAPLSQGILAGTNLASPVGQYRFGRAGEIIQCPRHGMEFDTLNGCSLHDPRRMRVKAYEVVERGDEIYVHL